MFFTAAKAQGQRHAHHPRSRGHNGAIVFHAARSPRTENHTPSRHGAKEGRKPTRYAHTVSELLQDARTEPKRYARSTNFTFQAAAIPSSKPVTVPTPPKTPLAAPQTANELVVLDSTRLGHWLWRQLRPIISSGRLCTQRVRNSLQGSDRRRSFSGGGKSAKTPCVHHDHAVPQMMMKNKCQETQQRSACESVSFTCSFPWRQQRIKNRSSWQTFVCDLEVLAVQIHVSLTSFVPRRTPPSAAD